MQCIGNQIIIVVPESVAVNFTFVEENIGKKMRENVEVIFLSSPAPGQQQQQQQQQDDRVDSLGKAIEGCTRLYMITQRWTEFIHTAEESLAVDLLKAAVSISIAARQKTNNDIQEVALPQSIIMCAFEDTQRLLDDGLASELPKTKLDGEDEDSSCSFPSFEGMRSLLDLASTSSNNSISIIHVLMAIMRQGEAKKGLCVIYDYETFQMFPHLEPAPS